MRSGLAILLALLACSSSTSPRRAGGMQVLFVGNSLTDANDLPAMVAVLATAGGDTIGTGTALGSGLGLIDHLNGATNAVQLIASQHWDVVVLQQGPTSTGGVCQDSLILWTTMFNAHIRRAGATPALFMVWPSSDRRAYFDNVRLAYELAAQESRGMFLPAGEAWRAAWAADATLPLYGSDGFHPSELGSWLAALEIYGRLSGRDVRTLPASAIPHVSASTARLLQQAAQDANDRFSAYPSGVTAPPGTARPPSGRC